MILMVIHLMISGIWLGSMAYSLAVVQPKVDQFFSDEQRREEFLITLAHGNRWKVIALILVLIGSGLGVVATSSGAVAVGYGIALILYVAAAAIFSYVTYRHWPARVFALPSELAGFRQRLRLCVVAMVISVGLAFVTTLSVSVR